MSDLINLPIIESAGGDVIGTVKTALVDLEARMLKSVVCKDRMLSKNISIIPMQYIIGLDKNRVLIRNRNAIRKVKQIAVEVRHLLYFENITDKVIINNTGDILGAIRDIVFDENTGSIRYYEVSEGYIDDITKGRLKVECDGMISFDESSGIFKSTNYIPVKRVQNERMDRIT